MSSFTEEWFSVESQKALTTLARRTKNLSGRVVEIGCWEGRSTCALAHAVYPANVEAIDTWEGSPGEVSADLAMNRDVLATFVGNIYDLTRGNVNIHRQGWREHFKTQRGRLRFVHIDAEHTYREVFDTITEVIPLMVSGGIICGDDAAHPPVLAAVQDKLGQVAFAASLWWWEAP